jgi:hypothetical protein
MKLVSKLAATTLAAVLLAALFAIGPGQAAAAQSHGGGGTGASAGGGSGGGGHGAGMSNEDPVPFTRDIEQAADEILSRLKAGKTMDARNSAGRLTAAAGKLPPHITDAAMQKRLTDTIHAIRTIAGARSPDLFDLEDQIAVLRAITAEARENLRGMN